MGIGTLLDCPGSDIDEMKLLCEAVEGFLLKSHDKGLIGPLYVTFFS